jgi:hypothetical protein
MILPPLVFPDHSIVKNLFGIQDGYLQVKMLTYKSY